MCGLGPKLIKGWRVIMFEKAKELFRLRKPPAEEDHNHLYKLRVKALKRTQTQKLNFNLLFNQQEYSSQKDSEATLYRRKLTINKVLEQPVINLKDLKRCSWNGVETDRAEVWKLLLGYLSPHRQNHPRQQLHHLQEYRRLLQNHNIEQCATKKLIEIDIPRTFFQIEELFNQPSVQGMLLRVLCLWDLTSNGYVQGMGDVAGLILMVLAKYDQDPKLTWFNSLPPDDLLMMEVDLYWLSRIVCTKFFGYYNISNTQDIEKTMNRIQSIIDKSDIFLSQHLKNHGVSIFQFAFRWIYVLLSREIPVRLIFRLMDSYFSASEDFEVLHCYVVSSLVLRFSVKLLKINSFNVLMRTLQNLPTKDWTKRDIELLVEEAVVLMHTYSQ